MDFFAFEKPFSYSSMHGFANSPSGSSVGLASNPNAYLNNQMSQYYSGMAGQVTSQYLAEFASCSAPLAADNGSGSLNIMYGDHQPSHDLNQAKDLSTDHMSSPEPHPQRSPGPGFRSSADHIGAVGSCQRLPLGTSATISA